MRRPQRDLTPVARGVLAGLLLACGACGGDDAPASGVPAAQRVDEACVGVEARVEQLMGFMTSTDDLELLLRAMREPAAADIGLGPQDASDKYLSIKTWIETARTVAPDVFRSPVVWDDVSQADGAVKLAHARSRLQAIDIDRLSREVGARREYIGTHLADVNRCLDVMRTVPGAAAPPAAGSR